MSLTADELRPCRGCGAPCDGDVCDQGCVELADAQAIVALGSYARPAMGNAKPKPEKGDNQLDRRSRTSDDRRLEKIAKAESKARDRHLCRFPDCEFKYQNLTKHSAHIHHKGMGGDPKQIRTTVDQLLTMCAKHHGHFDAGQFRVQPETSAGTDGPCLYRPRISGERFAAGVSDHFRRAL